MENITRTNFESGTHERLERSSGVAQTFLSVRSLPPPRLWRSLRKTGWSWKRS